MRSDVVHHIHLAFCSSNANNHLQLSVVHAVTGLELTSDLDFRSIGDPQHAAEQRKGGRVLSFQQLGLEK